jgi:hypothetical protein
MNTKAKPKKPVRNIIKTKGLLMNPNPVNLALRNNNCKKILTNGRKTTRKYFIPSQFPKLTGLTQKYKTKKVTKKV